jgi:subtilisin family serine protease
MRKKISWVPLVLLSAIFVMSVSIEDVAKAQGVDLRDVLIGFKNFPGNSEQAHVKAAGGEIKYTYQLIRAIAASVPSAAIEGLERNPNVTYIEDDGDFYVSDELSDSWGVDRIDAENAWPISRGAGIYVSIIDTGIDQDHPDLADNIDGGINFVRIKGTVDPGAWDDDNGHGTHCAGIVAADDNGIGIVGVAPDARLYGVKVMDKRGAGKLSDIIAGIEWSVLYGADEILDSGDEAKVISMSFGSYLGNYSLGEACQAAYDAGVVLVASAGNTNGGSINWPARYECVIAVSATDSFDDLASFSSVGSDMELTAPGVGIYSTNNDGLFTFMDGTSMSCPHVAGAAALVWASGPYQSSSAVRFQLGNTAEDIGLEPNEQGYGLVDTEYAVQLPIAAFNVIRLEPDQIRYQQGTTLPLSLTLEVEDQYGYKASGLTFNSIKSSIRGDSEIDYVPVDVSWTDTGFGVYKGELDISNLPAGQYGIKAVIMTDDGITGKTCFNAFLVEGAAEGYLVIEITTPKEIYSFGEWVNFTVKVTDEHSTSIAGAQVTGQFGTPQGIWDRKDDLTDANGIVIFRWRINKKDGLGIYTFNATGGKDGYIQGTGTKTIEVR